MDLTVGAIIEGKVKSITNFGAFIALPENRTGMVHISEVARTYVSDIKEFVKVGDVLKMKVLNIGEDGKISLSIKRALEPEKTSAPKERGERRTFQQPKIDGSYTWTPKKAEPQSFEEMMNRFKQTSEEKFSDLKRKNPEARRTKRGAAK